MTWALVQMRFRTWVLVLWAFFLPWQTRYIFGFSHLSGEPSPFGTLSLYATQVALLIGLLISLAITGRPRFRTEYQRVLGLAGMVWIIVGLSILVSAQQLAGLGAWLEVSFALLAFVALLDDKVDILTVLKGFIWGLLVPIGLGLCQVVAGGSGASTLLGLAKRSAGTPGDAVVMLDGVRYLRAYGTFSHPNIFAGYLAAGVGMLGVVYGSQAVKRRVLHGCLVGALLLGLLLTGSRSAILGLLIGLAAMLFVREVLRRDLLKGWPLAMVRARSRQVAGWALAGAMLVVAVAVALTLGAPAFVSSLRGGGVLEEQSVSERAEQYQEFASTLHGEDWLIGNGARNYVGALAESHPGRSVWAYQPIHNVPLLIFSELGLVGFVVIAWLVAQVYRFCTEQLWGRQTQGAFMAGLVLLAVAFFDHYLWSFWSGLALLALVGACLVRAHETNDVTNLG